MLRQHIEGYISKCTIAMSKLLSSLYVDDAVCGAEEEEGAFEFYSTSNSIEDRRV